MPAPPDLLAKLFCLRQFLQHLFSNAYLIPGLQKRVVSLPPMLTTVVHQSGNCCLPPQFMTEKHKLSCQATYCLEQTYLEKDGELSLHHLIPTNHLNLVNSGLDFGSLSMLAKLHVSLLPCLFTIFWSSWNLSESTAELMLLACTGCLQHSLGAEVPGKDAGAVSVML